MNHSRRCKDYSNGNTIEHYTRVLNVPIEHKRNQIEDQILVMDAQDGKAEALEMLVQRWQKRLWLHARRLTGDTEAAWDVTQSAWYDIIRRLKKLHDPASFPAWAYKITTCKAIDWIKKTRQNKSIPVENLDIADVPDKNNIEVEDYLKQLEFDQRAILSLYYFEELSIAEISVILKIPPGTVKSRLHTARNALKKRMTIS